MEKQHCRKFSLRLHYRIVNTYYDAAQFFLFREQIKLLFALSVYKINHTYHNLQPLSLADGYYFWLNAIHMQQFVITKDAMPCIFLLMIRTFPD